MRLAGALLLLAAAAVTPEIRYFRYERPVTVPNQNASASAQTCAVLDATTFTHANADLADLRLYHDRSETPFVIRTAEPVRSAGQKIALLNLGTRGGQTSFDAAMPEGPYSDMSLDVSGANFIAAVTVSGSQGQDTSHPTKLGSYTIFDLTDQKLGRSTVLHLPASDFRYLHFAIAGPLKPQQIGGISMSRGAQAETQYTVVAETSQVAQHGNQTTIQFTIPENVPVDRIAFVPGAEPVNFSRDVLVKETVVPARSMAEEEVPRTAEASGNLLRVHANRDGHRLDEEHLSIPAPWFSSGPAGSRWTITIDNGDDPPIDLKSVRLEMIQRRLCFDAAPGASYRLFYGDAALAAPRFDYARLFMAEKNAAQAVLGPEQVNPGYQKRPDTRPFTERHPWLLWVALTIVIAVLGIVALRTAKQTIPRS